MKDLQGLQLCILIDPLLESPPVAFHSETGPITRVDDRVTVMTIRRNVDWSDPTDLQLMNDLCLLTIQRSARLIVQDYSGAYIHNYYPLTDFGYPLLRHVLYDFTYNDGGCFVDFSKVKLLTHPDGSFVQPRYEPITSLINHLNTVELVKDRSRAIVTYARRLYRIHQGQEEYRDWCTAEVVQRRLSPFCFIYSLPLQTDVGTLERFMLAYIWDLCTAVGDYISEQDGLDMIRRPTAEYEDAIKLLESALTTENQH